MFQYQLQNLKNYVASLVQVYSQFVPIKCLKWNSIEIKDKFYCTHECRTYTRTTDPVAKRK